MKRNENATCGNCPYFGGDVGNQKGWCRLHGPATLGYPTRTMDVSWCGDHPDFRVKDTGRLERRRHVYGWTPEPKKEEDE